MNPTPGRAALAGLAILLLAIPLVEGQLNTFGTGVGAGDSDYVVLTKNASKMVGDTDTDDAGEAANVKVWRANLGEGEDWEDDCILVDTGTTIGKEPDPVDDLRLSTCGTDPAGTTIGEGWSGREKLAEEMTLQDNDCIRIRLADTVKQNDGYDKGETLYLVYYANADGSGGDCDDADQALITSSASLKTGIPRNQESDGAEGDWAIRLTPFGDHPAGSWVGPVDEDMLDYGSTAIDLSNKYTFGDREDKTFYLVANTADQVAVAKNTLLTAKSIRLGPLVAPAAPLVQVSNLELPEEAPVAGEEYKVKVRFSNDGKAPGVGLLVTKVDGAIVDVRMTPVLDAGQSGSAVVAVEVPHGGPFLLEVSGFKVNLDADGPLPSEGGDASAQAQVAQLEARIAQLEALLAADGDAADLDAQASASRGSPGVGTAFFVLALAGLAMLARRKAE